VSIFYFGRNDIRMINSLFRMNLADRFLGSSLGLVWAILSPLLLMSIFVFVFTYVFPGRLPGRAGTLPFIIWLLSGYAPWLGLSEGLSSATTSVVGNAGVVKNIAFKSEILPIVGAMMGVVPLAVGLVVIFLLQLFGGEPINAAVLVLPLIILLQLFFVSGMGLFLSALNVFVRDTAIALPSVLTALLFASPIFYALSSYPAPIQRFLVYNPFYVMAECFRAPILHGTLPPLWMLVYMVVVSTVLFVGGLWWFRRLKSFFDTRL
jgi:ABC-type polysaccharide/polyol phosphate export permease